MLELRTENGPKVLAPGGILAPIYQKKASFFFLIRYLAEYGVCANPKE